MSMEAAANANGEYLDTSQPEAVRTESQDGECRHPYAFQDDLRRPEEWSHQLYKGPEGSSWMSLRMHVKGRCVQEQVYYGEDSVEQYEDRGATLCDEQM